MKTKYNLIYGDKYKWYQNRKEKLVKDFNLLFNEEPTNFFSSPGRVEILGNHTDHNQGLVLVSSINLDIFAAVSKRDDNMIYLKSRGYSMNIIDLSDLDIKESEYSKSNSIIRGVSNKLKELGYKIGGFNCTTESLIFKGAGISSSAAFELLIGEIINNLYNDGLIDKVTLAKVGQYAENVYYNKPSGLLDQMGVSLGGFNFIDFKEKENPQIEHFNIDLKKYRVVLINTGGSHGNLTPLYKSIKDDMINTAKLFNKSVLRELPEKDFYDNIPLIKRKLGGRAILRSIHFFDENKRVLSGYKALKNDNVDEFLKLINESGDSSYRLLENCFVQKDNKQGISLAVNLSKLYLENTGAVRVHGGGFKGTVIAYVPLKKKSDYISKMKKVFGERNVVLVKLRQVGTTEVIE